MARAGSTGGSRAYRGQRPVRWYATLVLICVVGVGLIWYSRYERQHPSSTGQPAVGTKWFAAYSFDICGTVEPFLPANPTVKGASFGITTDADGVLHIAPLKADQAGANATLGAFASDYKGMVLSTSQLRYPGRRKAGPTVGRTFTLGEKCPAGTKDAGKPGVVEVANWTSPTATKSVMLGDPPNQKVGDQQEYTFAFLPKGVSVPRPTGKAVTSMLDDATAAAASTGSSASTGSTSVGSTSVGSASTGSTASSASSGSAGSASTGTASSSAGSGGTGSSG